MTSRSDISSVGIIGFGSFGRFAASLLPPDIKVVVYDPKPARIPAQPADATLDAVCAADVIIMAVPLSAYPAVLRGIKDKLRSMTLVVDVCSVKTKPEQLFAEHLPNHRNILMTHPLFGPQSAVNSVVGHHLIVTKQYGARAAQVLRFCVQSLGLTVSTMTSEEHDRVMASVHALTFFVARILSNMPAADVPFKTPSYGMLTDLMTLDKTHSEDLFNTIQTGNPFAKATRRAFRKSLTEVERTLSAQETS